MDIPDTFFHPALKARKADADPIVHALREHLRKKCDELLTPGHPEYIDYEERKAEWWTARRGGRRLPAAIERLAAGGVLLDERYAREAAAILRTIVDHRIVEETGGTNYGRPYRTWRDNPLDAGASSEMLAVGLDLLHPSLPPEDAARFGDYLVPFVDYILDNPPDPEEKRPDWNIAAIGLIGVGILSLVLRSIGVLDEGRCARAVELGKRRSLLFLEKGHDGQGAFYEGPAYGGATLERLAPFARALARCGDRELVEHGGWRLIAEGLTHELIPGTGRPNPLNDCNDQFSIGWVLLLASEAQDGLAQWLWQRIDGILGGRTGELFDDVWTGDVTRYLLYYDPSVKPVPPDRVGLSISKHFRNRGLVDIRSGWEEDGFFLSSVCDVFPAGGHRQADRNQFAFHALGESFAIDSGYCLERLPDTTEVLRLGALGEAHNLPLIHGEMQRRGVVSGDGIRRVDLDAPIPYIESEAGESHPSAERFTRRLVCLPGGDGNPSCLVVADRLTFEMGDRPLLSWLLHTHSDNGVELARDRFTLIGGRKGNRCDVRIVTPWPGRWREEVFFDHPRLRYDWFWNPLLCLVVLAPYRSGEAPPEISAEGDVNGCALAIRIGDSTYTVLSAAPDRTVAFNDIETDAEFVLIRTREESVIAYLLSAGTLLKAQGRSLVDGDTPVDYAQNGEDENG